MDGDSRLVRRRPIRPHGVRRRGARGGRVDALGRGPMEARDRDRIQALGAPHRQGRAPGIAGERRAPKPALVRGRAALGDVLMRTAILVLIAMLVAVALVAAEPALAGVIEGSVTLTPADLSIHDTSKPNPYVGQLSASSRIAAAAAAVDTVYGVA